MAANGSGGRGAKADGPRGRHQAPAEERPNPSADRRIWATCIRNPLFGIFARELLGVLFVPATTAVFVLTAWGRVDWGDPWLAVCRISVAFVPMAIGAALGDLLPV